MGPGQDRVAVSTAGHHAQDFRARPIDPDVPAHRPRPSGAYRAYHYLDASYRTFLRYPSPVGTTSPRGHSWDQETISTGRAPVALPWAVHSVRLDQGREDSLLAVAVVSGPILLGHRD